jgi:hypothetical protein
MVPRLPAREGFRSSPTTAGHVVVFVAAKTKREAMRRRVDPRMHHKPLTMHERAACVVLRAKRRRSRLALRAQGNHQLTILTVR